MENPLSQYLQETYEQIEARVSVEMDKSRRAANEEMNQIMRRLRQCRSTEEVARWLIDSTSSFSGQAALFEVTSTMFRGVGARGFPFEHERFGQLEIPLDRAPALAQSARECDMVVAAGSHGEISPEVAAALGHRPDEKVYLYPIVIEGKTVAILYATLVVDSAALELLTQAGANAARIIASASQPQPDTHLVTIEGANDRAAILRRAKEARARWYARAAVAGILLRRGQAVERGRVERDIYGALRPEIDAARRVYKQDYLAVSPAMADYLHRELLKLAHDDASLLGPDYPGSLV